MAAAVVAVLVKSAVWVVFVRLAGTVGFAFHPMTAGMSISIRFITFSVPVVVTKTGSIMMMFAVEMF